jgi:hypothetical protein
MLTVAKLIINSINLRIFILQQAHDFIESGYPGENKIYEFIYYTYF